MDLSNLSNTLPLDNTRAGNTTAVHSSTTTTPIPNINQDLTNHFKDAAKSVASLYNISLNNTVDNSVSNRNIKTEFANAAKAVASLYKLGQSSQLTSYTKGYLQCLEDLLAVLTNNEDIEDWVLTRRIELMNHAGNPSSKPPSSGDSSQHSEPDPFTIPHDYEFTFNLDIKPPVHFRPGIPPISVQHNLKQRASIGNHHSRHNKKILSSEDSIMIDDSDNEEKEVKLQLFPKYLKESPLKKKKKI